MIFLIVDRNRVRRSLLRDQTLNKSSRRLNRGRTSLALQMAKKPVDDDAVSALVFLRQVSVLEGVRPIWERYCSAHGNNINKCSPLMQEKISTFCILPDFLR